MPENNNIIETQQAQLLSRIAQKDPAALSELYDQTSASFFSFAVRMLNDVHDAEEVIQDVYVQIWNKSQSFDPALGLAFHWAMSIVRNRCIDRIRSRQRRSRVVVEFVDGVEFEPVVDSALPQTSLAKDELGAVRTALDFLPQDQKQAIELSFFSGLSHPEIADQLDEPLGTIKARIRRGMFKLRAELEAYA